MDTFGKRLKILREERDLSLTDMAKILDTTKSTLSRYENGKVDPSLNVVIEYAKRLGVSIDWISGIADINNMTNKTIETLNRETLGRMSEYCRVYEKIEKSNIPPEKLEKLIDVMKE